MFHTLTLEEKRATTRNLRNYTILRQTWQGVARNIQEGGGSYCVMPRVQTDCYVDKHALFRIKSYSFWMTS